MLECLELRRAGEELRQELSHALYKEDAAMRVLARLTRERDEAREALASVKATLGPAFSAGESAPAAGDVEMEVEAEAAVGLPAAATARVQDTSKALSATRKKRKPAADYVTPATVKSYVELSTVPSLHTTKPPGVSALDLGNEGNLLVTGGFDKAVQVYDRTTSKIVATLKGHTKKVTSVAASTQLNDASLPTFLVSASLDKSLRVWTPSGTKTVYSTYGNIALGSEVNDVSIHPSQTLAISAQQDGTWAVHDLDIASGKPSIILTGALPDDADPTTANTAIAFHPDGAIFGLGSSDSKIRIFDVVSGKCIASFDGHGAGPITSLSFSENGYTLASAAEASTEVKIWDLRKLSNSANIALGDDYGTVNVVEFDESAQFLSVAGKDLRVFQNKTWEELFKSEENTAELTGVKWTKSGKEVVTSGVDRTVRVLGIKEE